MTLSFGLGQSEIPWGTASGLSTADINRICDEIASTGAKSIRMSAVWQFIEPTRNHKYKVGPGSAIDAAITAAEASDLDILLIVEPRRTSFLQILGVPIGIAATQSNATDYGLMCGGIAQAYGDRIKYWEIGNEINNMGFFGAPSDPAKYLEFLRAAYNNIMPAAPSSLIFAGALQAVATDPDLGRTMNPVDWVTKFYDANPQGTYHGISMHPYSTDGNFNPMTPTPDNEYAFGNIAAMRAIMDAAGDTAIPIVCTEWGYDSVRSLSGLSTTQDELEAEQAANIVTHFDILSTYSSMIFPITWIYDGRDQNAKGEEQDSYGMERSDYTRKAAYAAIHGLGVWPGSVTDGIGITDTADVDVRPSGLYVPATDSLGITDSPSFDLVTAAATFVSKGSGTPNTSNTHDVIAAWTATIVALPNGAHVVPVVVSSDHSKPSNLYSTLAVNSDIDGALMKLGSIQIASTTNEKGSIHFFGLVDSIVGGVILTKVPTAGTHNMTAEVATTDGVTKFDSVYGNSFLCQDVSAFGTVSSVHSAAGGNTPDLKVNAAIDNLLFFLFGGTRDFNHSFGGATIQDHGGATPAGGGNGGFYLVATAPGAIGVEAAIPPSYITVYSALALELIHA